MVPKLTAPLRKGLRQLEAEKERIDREIAALRTALEALEDTSRRVPTSTRTRARRRAMSAAARRAVSRRMKAYWAKRREASARSKPRSTPKAE